MADNDRTNEITRRVLDSLAELVGISLENSEEFEQKLDKAVEAEVEEQLQQTNVRPDDIEGLDNYIDERVSSYFEESGREESQRRAIEQAVEEATDEHFNNIDWDTVLPAERVDRVIRAHVDELFQQRINRLPLEAISQVLISPAAQQVVHRIVVASMRGVLASVLSHLMSIPTAQPVHPVHPGAGCATNTAAASPANSGSNEGA